MLAVYTLYYFLSAILAHTFIPHPDGGCNIENRLPSWHVTNVETQKCWKLGLMLLWFKFDQKGRIMNGTPCESHYDHSQC